MFDRASTKAQAKLQLKGNIGMLFLITIVAGMVMSFTLYITAPPIAIGIIMIYLGMTNGKNPELGDLFKGFSLFGKSWWLAIITGFFTCLWMMLLYIPGYIKMYAYSLAPYILAENPTMTAREALNESKRITNGAKMDLFVMDLSFIGWALLVGLTGGLAGIYVFPYMNATWANAYQAIKAKQGSAA